MNSRRKQRAALSALLLAVMFAEGATGRPLLLVCAALIALFGPALPPRFLDLAIALWTFAIGVSIAHDWKMF